MYFILSYLVIDTICVFFFLFCFVFFSMRLFLIVPGSRPTTLVTAAIYMRRIRVYCHNNNNNNNKVMMTMIMIVILT